MLICKDPPHVQVEIDKATRAKAFTVEDRTRLLQRVMPWMRQKKYDEALRELVDFVEAALRTTSAKARSAAPGARPPAGLLPPPRAAAPKQVPGERNSMLTWIVIGLVLFAGLWIVLAIVRALFRGLFGGGGGGYGAPGGPGGYGGGYGGGGGGGFMSSLMGGLFGAAAGNWMYDSFFRGSHSEGWRDQQALGGQSGDNGGALRDEPGAGDFSDDPGGGGADFGDDAGGGDYGGGGFDSGGDFGGGGGGDFGGGGGDF